MPQLLNTQLRVPAHGRFLSMVQSHVRELATTAGFVPKEVLALELAAEEAFLNILRHAYPDGTSGDVFLDGRIGEMEMQLVFRDEGLPFDPSLIPAPAPQAPGEDPDPGSLGFKLIRHAVDEAHWVNCGRQGKELRLIKRLTQASESELPVLPAKLVPAPAQAYEIRPMRPDEAIQVARIFWLAYGYSYKNDDFYRPDGLRSLIGSGKVISFVAVTGAGEVVGHAGLLRPEPTTPMAEMAVLVVSPAHRGRGIMAALSDALYGKAKELGLVGLSMNPVTSHAASQREVMQLGGKICGLDLAACPPRQFKAMRLENTAPQRESYLSCFLYLTDPPSALAHVPARHQALVKRIYESLQRPLRLGRPEEATAAGEYQVFFDRTLAKGIVRVVRADPLQWPEVYRATLDLAAIAGAEVVDLDLPLAQPATPLVWELAEAAGFFLTGIRPHEAADGDALRLTRLYTPFDLGQLRLYPHFGRELAAYVGAEMARAALLTPRSGLVDQN